MSEENEVKQRPERFTSELKSRPIVEKKSALRKVFESLIEEDLSTIKDKVIDEVIIPSVKEELANVLHNTISTLFGYSGRYNSAQTQNGRVIDRVNHVGNDYSSISRTRSGVAYRSQQLQEASTPSLSPYNIQELRWPRFEDAKYVLDSMREVIRNYDSVSINDMYDIGDPGHSSVNFRDIPPEACNWGWINLSTATVVPRHGYYALKLPKPVPLK